jgi:RNA polymerase sigma-70 factor (ECF subfamily)
MIRQATNQKEESRLIARLKQGEKDAFEELYKKYHKEVLSLCLRMTGNRADAEDKAQETFLNVFRFIGGFNGKASLSTWIHRIAVNQVGMGKRRKRVETVSLEIADPQSEGGSRTWEIPAQDKNLKGSVDRMTLEVMINHLPPGYRLTLILHDIEGYEHREIATMNGNTVGSSKSQLNRARKCARNLIGKSPARTSVKKKQTKKKGV